MKESTPAVLDVMIAVLGADLDLPVTSVTAQTTFADLDMDSIAMTELGAILEEELGIEVADEDITMEDTLGGMAALLERKLAAQPAATIRVPSARTS
ncbi:acyl carrier protein [Actinomadura barringtoniae]|uniref:Acyl carrier protein n=1 Tax=Actinomadura barringtoniae TaxID=1427535 RepID=A0A939PLV7_9ACTN|nr:acyl carrier protein [Actinomadura barringtoniae]MBO2450946.1 acyl carrier protein [Actinomadura barringtoniae]